MSYFEERMEEIRREQKERQPPPVIEEPLPVKAKKVRLGFVYFIKSGVMVKIGFSADPMARLSQLRVGSISKLTLVALVPGTEETEIAFHQAFWRLREHGEWFRHTGALKAFLETAPKCSLARREVARERERVIDL